MKEYWLKRLRDNLRPINEIAPDNEFYHHHYGRNFATSDVTEMINPRRAAVLVPLVWRENTLKVVLTLRTSHLRSHAGQISFPGGSADEGDENLVQTALREANEEIGIGANFINPIGCGENYYTGSNFLITPIVALVDESAEYIRDANEVEKIFELPFEFLIDRENQKVHSAIFQGATRKYIAIECEGYRVWGVTAALLRGLSFMLNAKQAAKD